MYCPIPGIVEGKSMYTGTLELESRTITAGGKVLIPIAGLQAGQAVKHIVCELDGTLTNSTGAIINTSARILNNVIAILQLKSARYKVRATGFQMACLYRAMHGKNATDNAYAVPATGSIPAKGWLWIEFRDTRAVQPDEFDMPCELLESKNIELAFAQSLTLATGLTFAGTVRPTVFYAPPKSHGYLPPSVLIDYADWGGQTANLTPGTYTDLYVIDETDGSVSIAQVTNLRLRMDGANVLDTVRSEMLVAKFNHEQVAGGDIGNDSEGLPADNFLFLPGITPPFGYQIPNLPTGMTSVRADITGTTTAPRFFSRVIEQTTDATDSNDIAAVEHITPVAASKTPRAPATASKLRIVGSPLRVQHVSSTIAKAYPRAVK
jgi:hypothetical protein